MFRAEGSDKDVIWVLFCICFISSSLEKKSRRFGAGDMEMLSTVSHQQLFAWCVWGVTELRKCLVSAWLSLG